MSDGEELTELISALRDGSMSLDEVAQRFRERSWPRIRVRRPTNYLELAAAAEEDPPPIVPGSFDQVSAAYRRGYMTRAQYEVLLQAFAESSPAEAPGGSPAGAP